MMSTRFGTNIDMIRMVAKALSFLKHYLSMFMTTYQLLLKQLMLRKRQPGTARPLRGVGGKGFAALDNARN